MQTFATMFGDVVNRPTFIAKRSLLSRRLLLLVSFVVVVWGSLRAMLSCRMTHKALALLAIHSTVIRRARRGDRWVQTINQTEKGNLDGRT